MIGSEHSSGTKAPPVVIRNAMLSDAVAMRNLVIASRVLDVNSPYAYVMVCDRFASTSIVASAGMEIVGFVSAFPPPGRPDTIFVWQIAVSQNMQGQGLGVRMLDSVLSSPACRGIRRLEATVTPSNEASRRMFHSLARQRGATISIDEDYYQTGLFQEPDHESEALVRIGPFAES